MDKAHREVADTLHLRRGQFKAQAAAAASMPGLDADLELANRQASAKVAVALAPRPDEDEWRDVARFTFPLLFMSQMTRLTSKNWRR
jgi:hypothetical protein